MRAVFGFSQRLPVSRMALLYPVDICSTEPELFFSHTMNKHCFCESPYAPISYHNGYIPSWGQKVQDKSEEMSEDRFLAQGASTASHGMLFDQRLEANRFHLFMSGQEEWHLGFGLNIQSYIHSVSYFMCRGKRMWNITQFSRLCNLDICRYEVPPSFYKLPCWGGLLWSFLFHEDHRKLSWTTAFELTAP